MAGNGVDPCPAPVGRPHQRRPVIPSTIESSDNSLARICSRPRLGVLVHRPKILGCTHGAWRWWRHRPGHTSLYNQIQGSDDAPKREGCMRLVMATADFLVAGRSFAGFPLLLDDDGWPMEPAQSFLWHTLILLCQIRYHFDAPRVSACFL